MKTRRGFTLLEVLIVVAISAVTALTSVPIFVGHVEASRAGEARATMMAIFDRARTVYQQTGKAPNTLAEIKLSTGEVATSSFTSTSYSFNSSAKNWKITCANVYTKAPKNYVMNVNLVTGEYSFTR